MPFGKGLHTLQQRNAPMTLPQAQASPLSKLHISTVENLLRYCLATVEVVGIQAGVWVGFLVRIWYS